MTAPKTARAAALLLLVLASAGTTTGAPAPFPRAGRPAQRARFEGTWKQVSVAFEGVDRTAAERPFRHHWVIKADTITIFLKGKQNAGSWTYRLDTTRKPATLDLTVADGPSRGETYPSICKVEGDRLTVLLQSFPKRGRPRDFSARSEPGVGRHVFVRVKSGEVE
jgi:uncharacterized protein (TIGR03067 family)